MWFTFPVVDLEFHSSNLGGVWEVAGSAAPAGPTPVIPATLSTDVILLYPHPPTSFPTLIMSLLSIRDIPATRYHCDFRLTNTALSSAFAQQYYLDNTDTIPLTIKVNTSRAVTFMVPVETLTSHYCPPGSQLILGRDVQAACIQASEPDLPDTLQQSFSQLVPTQPVALSTSYSFGASVFSVSPQSATAFRENPGVAEKPLHDNNSEHVTFGTSMSPPQLPPQLTSQPRTFEPSTLSVPNPNSGAAENLLSTDNNSQH
ncbi:hypothetical protein K435DRAFT_794677 [Dendrothele bispora CBS 962.96]|uniref:Uncharacterized protein n=1 Tax=Dendrothele bispora (strain CBS 962.96) TaxID=1314807 RepID=A0A4S8MCG6_DENBC|nr:hypothetical protein K435DRAFT_794677 [Dendrothele bispora CBS 962.96]